MTEQTTTELSRRDFLSACIVPCSNLTPSMMVAALGIALPEIRQTFSLSEIEAGSLFSVMMIVAAVTSGIAGRLADRFGPKTVLIAGLSLLALGFGGAGISGQGILFFSCLALTGIGYGFTPPSQYAIMSDLLPHRRGLGASLVSVAYGIGGAVGAVLASRVAAAFGWRAAFVTVAAIATTIMLLQLYWIRNTQRITTAARSGSFRDALSFPILILALAEFAGGSVFWSCAAWTPTLLRSAKALTLQETGWVMGVLSLANMLGAFSLGALSDKLGRKRVIILSALPAAAAAFVVFYWLTSAVGIALGILVFGILKATVPALVVALAQEAAPAGSPGSASGIIMSLHYTSGVLAPLIAAQLITGTGDIVLAMIMVSAVPLILYAALIGTVREHRRL
ncbi:MAG: MFS transporter [Deltaproteobacteria bacterium]|nr:MFS transporter [Deltaproteobacteria bacterium]